MGDETNADPQFLSFFIVEEAATRIDIIIHSPAEIHLYGEGGEHTGVVDSDAAGVAFEENVPNSMFALLPGRKQFASARAQPGLRIQGRGAATGTFDLEIQTFVDDVEVEEALFVQVPTTSKLLFEVDVGTSLADAELRIDVEGDGAIDAIVEVGETIPEEITSGSAVLAIVELTSFIEDSATGSTGRILGRLLSTSRGLIDRSERLRERGLDQIADALIQTVVALLKRIAGLTERFQGLGLVDGETAEYIVEEAGSIVLILERS